MNFYNVKDNNQFIKVYDKEELSKMIFDSIDYYETRATELDKENHELHAHALEIVNEELKNKIQLLQERLDMSYLEFNSQKEKQAYLNFTQRHMEERLQSKIADGKAPFLVPYYNGIGRNLTVVCPICGEKEDITDTEVW